MAPDNAQTEEQLDNHSEGSEVHIREFSSKSSTALVVAVITALSIIGASWISRVPDMEPLSAYRGAAIERQLNRLSGEYLALTKILKTLSDKTTGLAHNDDKADEIMDIFKQELEHVHVEIDLAKNDILNIKNDDDNCNIRQMKLERLNELHEEKYHDLYEKVTTYQGATKQRDATQDRQIDKIMQYFYRRGIPD